MAFAVFFSFIYFLEVFLTLFSFAKLLQICAEEKIPEFQTIVGKNRRIFSALAFVQPGIGVVYLIFEILAVSLFFLYKLDFNPLPILLLILGILMFFAFRESSPLLLSAIIPINFLTMAFCARDIYLFVFHTTRPMAPDATDFQKSQFGSQFGSRSGSQSQSQSQFGSGSRSGHAGLVGMSRGSLAVHFLESIFALCELAIAISVTIIICRSLWNNTVEIPK